MKIRVETIKNLSEDRIEVYCCERTKRIEDIIHYIKETNTFTIIGYIKDKQQIIDKANILYFESVDKKCYAYTQQEVYQIHTTLIELEENMKGIEFIRVNKSTIINLYKVRSIKADINMRTIINFVNNEKAVVTRHYSKAFKNSLYKLRNQLNNE